MAHDIEQEPIKSPRMSHDHVHSWVGECFLCIEPNVGDVIP